MRHAPSTRLSQRETHVYVYILSRSRLEPIIIMQDPVHEISGVVKSLVMAKDATDQRDSLQRYFAPDASFDHLMCSVASSANVSPRKQ